MLFDYIRILRKDGVATIEDYSYANQDEASKSDLNLIAATDCLLVGMQYPFNNFFLHLDTPNTLASVMKLEYWDGKAWTEAVDIMDGSSAGGISLAKSGHVLFALDKQKTGWQKLVDPTQESHPAELDNLKIYDLYWLRISFSADLDPLTKLNELGFAFTTGEKLRSIKAEVDKFMGAFKTGKTNWIPEILTASKMLVTEFKKAGLVLGPQQVVRMDDFWLPATYKTLWLIYNSLGPAYLETANQMAHQFYKTMNVDNITVDVNRNGQPDESEKDSRVKVGVR